MNPAICSVLSTLVDRVVALQRESQEVIEQLHVVNHEVHSFSSFDSLHVAIEAVEVERLHQLAEYASDLKDELCALVWQAEVRARRLRGLTFAVYRLLAWKHRALTNYYHPKAGGGKRWREEYEAEYDAN